MKLILVGLDGSNRAPHVLQAAIELARRFGAKLTLCRAVGVPHEVPPEAYSLSPTNLLGVIETEAKDYLDHVAKACPPEILGERVVQLGVPWQGVCEVAERLGVDLIVVGSHGYSGLDVILGTTAAKIVNHAKTSVLVVRGSLVD